MQTTTKMILAICCIGAVAVETCACGSDRLRSGRYLRTGERRIIGIGRVPDSSRNISKTSCEPSSSIGEPTISCST
jgi:hypothetical protein